MSSNDRPVYAPSSHELPNIIGIDVGYGNTKVYGTAIGDRNREQSFHFPSLAVRVAGMTEKNPIGAKYQVTRVWSDGQEYFVGTDAPRLVQRPLRSSLERTYPLGLVQFGEEYGNPATEQMAIAVLATLPVFLLFMINACTQL